MKGWKECKRCKEGEDEGRKLVGCCRRSYALEMGSARPFIDKSIVAVTRFARVKIPATLLQLPPSRIRGGGDSLFGVHDSVLYLGNRFSAVSEAFRPDFDAVRGVA